MQQESTYWQRFWGKRVGRRRLLQGAALGGVGLAAAAVIGCSDDESTGSTPAPSGSGAASDTPRSGGTVTFIQTSSDNTPIDIHKISFNASHRPGIAYSKLMMHDLTKYPNELAFTGDLAESFEIPDPTTYVFHLRHGVKWQNIPPVNGREFKAADVVYSFNRQKSEGVNAGIIASLKTIEATDDYTLKITLAKPDADFLWSLADNRTQVLTQEAVESAGGDLSNGPTIGTGPWIYEDRVPDQLLKMRKNPDYFRTELPYADRYESPVILDQNTAQAAFRTGQVLDVNTNGQVTKLLKQSVPNLVVQDSKLLIAGGGDRLWVSPINGPTKDVRVRQALGKLFDRDAIIDQVYFGSGWKNAGVFTNLNDWLLPESELNKYLGYDPQGAKQLLQAAGVDLASWKPELDAGIASRTNSPTTEYYVSQLKTAGIDATIRVIDKVEITDRVFGRGDTQFCICNNAPTRGTNPHLYTFFHSSGRGALLFKQLEGHEAFDALIDKQSTILNNEERKAAVQDVQRKNLELAVAIMVVNDNGEYAVSPKVGGYKYNPEEQMRYAYAYLKA